MSTIECIVKGASVEPYRYQTGIHPTKVARKVASLKERMKRKRPVEYFKGLVPSLVQHEYLTQDTIKAKHKFAVSQYRMSFFCVSYSLSDSFLMHYACTCTTNQRPYLVYDVTSKGMKALVDGPIMLPVPLSVREQEALEEERKQKVISELKDKGVDMEQIPPEELEAGEGEAITALKRWYSYVDSMTARGRTDIVNELDDLKNRIEAWRLDMAEKYRMAPASVIEEHLLVKIAYATASLRAGGRMDKDALVATGVRSSGIDELTSVLDEWAKDAKSGMDSNDESSCDPMIFQPGQKFQPSNSWRFAVYKPNKKTGKATWEVSYDRFIKGEHPLTIAMTQKSGKPIQVATVVGHILDALVQGRDVDLHRLSTSELPPNRSEWQELVRCSVETGIDVTGGEL